MLERCTSTDNISYGVSGGFPSFGLASLAVAQCKLDRNVVGQSRQEHDCKQVVKLNIFLDSCEPRATVTRSAIRLCGEVRT